VKGDGRVSVSFFGDGATGEGVLYESMNLAAVLKLPVIFVCENNLYSTHLPIRECRVSEEIAPIAAPLGVWAQPVDGNDVLAVHGVAKEAVARCRSGEGPAFIEAKTYRMRGHVGPDDYIQGSHTDIRPPEEIAAWKERDPIATFRARLLSTREANGPELDRLDREVEEEVRSAVASAKASPFPTPEEISRNVFDKP
jgi:acetoin:2,6-dichlorophenolindophenol oxidoreductase subunit alpha